MPPRWLTLVASALVALTLLAVRDLVQTRHSIRRVYPLIGRIRYVIEKGARAPPVHRHERPRGAALQPLAALLGLPDREGCQLGRRLRHPARRAPARLVPLPPLRLPHAHRGGARRERRARDRARPPAPVRRALPYQRRADVLRRALRSRGARARDGCHRTRLLHRHRRGRALAAPPRWQRRRRLPDRTGALRRAHAGRAARLGAPARDRRAPAAARDRDQGSVRAPRVAPARRRSRSPTTWACRCTTRS